MIQNVLIAGSGGFVGTVARYAIGELARRRLPPTFPHATFAINVTGCFLIGFLGVLADERLGLSPTARLFWMTGVLGGYTTFSTFGYETALLLRGGHSLAAGLNVVGQVALGLLAVWVGATAARSLA